MTEERLIPLEDIGDLTPTPGLATRGVDMGELVQRAAQQLEDNANEKERINRYLPEAPAQTDTYEVQIRAIDARYIVGEVGPLFGAPRGLYATGRSVKEVTARIRSVWSQALLAAGIEPPDARKRAGEARFVAVS